MKYSIKLCQDYTVDKWCNIIENWMTTNIDGEEYKPATMYKLILLPREQVKYLIKNKSFESIFADKINELFPNDYFLKLSLRSPKDVLEKEIKIKDSEHRSVKLWKKIQQLNALKVSNINDITYLLLNSKRIKEDFKLYLKDSEADELYLCFQEWRPNLGNSIEYRCFIKNRKLTGICLYKPEYYSSRTVIPVEEIKHFIEQLLKIINYLDFIVDVFVRDNKVYFIEINPFCKLVDTFSFEWDDINNTDKLLVTL
jgi:hypothetical protein